MRKRDAEPGGLLQIMASRVWQMMFCNSLAMGCGNIARTLAEVAV
jgi:hypothetical protein